MFATQVSRLRKGNWKQVRAFFDVVLGDEEDGTFTPVFVVKGCALKLKKDTTDQFYFQFPSKPRMKDGEQVTENGFPVFDDHVQKALEKKGDKWGPTATARKAYDRVLEQAVAAYEAAPDENDGRGQAKPKAAKPKAAANRTAVDEPAPAAAFDEEDDDLPF